MAELTQTELTPSQQAVLHAHSLLRDSFNKSDLDNLNLLSKDIIPYLSDYFLLMNDMKNTLQEVTRRCFFDYSFLGVPVHKAFESYLSNLLAFVFGFKVSREKGEGYTVGHFLKYKEDQKTTTLKKIKKMPWIKKISNGSWIERWEELNKEWITNRNPLTHPEEGNISTLIQAEQAASSIIREMKVSITLFGDEYIQPLIEEYNKRKAKEAAKIEANKTTAEK